MSERYENGEYSTMVFEELESIKRKPNGSVDIKGFMELYNRRLYNVKEIVEYCAKTNSRWYSIRERLERDPSPKGLIITGELLSERFNAEEDEMERGKLYDVGDLLAECVGIAAYAENQVKI